MYFIRILSTLYSRLGQIVVGGLLITDKLITYKLITYKLIILTK